MFLEYSVSSQLKVEYKGKLQAWMEQGWFLPYPEEQLGPSKGIILLMVVMQANKNKIRLVMDFRKLIAYINTFRPKWISVQKN